LPKHLLSQNEAVKENNGFWYPYSSKTNKFTDLLELNVRGTLGDHSKLSIVGFLRLKRLRSYWPFASEG
jgi:hypothetical protein